MMTDTKKRELKKHLFNFINCGGVTATIAAIVIIITIIAVYIMDVEDVELIDWTIFTSIVFALLLDVLSKMLSGLFMNLLEDDIKLTTNYEKLSRKYINPQIEFDNTKSAKINIAKFEELFRKNSTKGKVVYKVKIPVVCEAYLEDKMIIVEDSKEMFELPELVSEHFDEIFSAHATSNIYNQQNIRIRNWEIQGDTFLVKTQRTTYFSSMVTNRAMDFKWGDGMSVRDLFECGPYLNLLKDSELSNHIGFNGLLESLDGHVVFVKRSGKTSIGKRAYGCSFEASLKTKYALNTNGDFTEEGLRKGIVEEIRDELKIPQSGLEEIDINKNIIAAYRDLLEGGKPQFFIVVKSNWSKEKIIQNFKEELKKSNKSEMLEDGEHLMWISKNTLKEVCLLEGMMIHEGRCYRMMPSSVACVAMYLQQAN